jgi:histidine kinase
MPTTAWNRSTLLLLLAGCGAALAAWITYRQVEVRTLREESAQLQRQLDLHSQAIRQWIDRYRTLPSVMALDQELRGALLEPIDAVRRARLNAHLEAANVVTRSSTLTLIGLDGVAIAASNWQQSTSNVGENYSFRPYVRQALESGRGQFYGIGLTTAKPGYFLSEALRDDAGRTIGVIVVKIELDALEAEWLGLADVVMVSDAHGVVFLANRDELRYRTLAPLSQAERAELALTRQYLDQNLSPIAIENREPLAEGGSRVHIAGLTPAQTMLWRTDSLPEQGWTLHLLHDPSSIATAARASALAAGGAWLALVFLLLFVQQRRRLNLLRLRSREELEAVLRQHAEELRTAQDIFVESARRADAGLSRSLEHLPQGVVIIDAQLRLVAWNSRYVELFRFPPDLLRVGQPIETLFRYNAQRGLLGPGPGEEAIQRRLEHLRSGKAHLRESEKQDGTVLEIRGNPLPDGGFVTSYADITSYKNAARELRSLADALERRIEERTRALASAKLEAENANRYKTRFVAAAVHDLLQPLNAARMFVSALRSRVDDAESRRIAEHAAQALLAQDAILNSLLDIARIESGAMATQVRDFPLAPLLEALAREFGVLAEARGLRLHQAATRIVVRSDEALLRRILQNFLSNAVRYTPKGRLLIGCRRVRAGVRIEVHDQGTGIPESLQKEIFEEFRRLNDGVASDRGAGLGLAIVERIGRLLGHRISLRSQLGKGSIFGVEVPTGDPSAAAPMPAPVTAAEEEPPRLDCRVWCIDADPVAREATRGVLARWGCSIEFCAGADAAAAAATCGSCPDLLLIDAGREAVDTASLHRNLCQRWGRSPATILLSATRDQATRIDAAAHGWGHLVKPVRASALRGLIAQLLLRHQAPRARASG